MKKKVARVYLLDTLYHLDKQYDYYLPEDLEEGVREGSIVVVPFGNGNRKKQAVVCSLESGSEKENLKPLFENPDSEFILSEELFKICLFVKEYAFCTFGDAFRAAVPSSVYSTIKYSYEPMVKLDDERVNNLNEKSSCLYNYICANLTGGKISCSKLKSEFGEDVEKALSPLKRIGLIRLREDVKEARGLPFREYVYLNIPRDEAKRLLEGKWENINPDGKKLMRGKNRRKLIELLLDSEFIPADRLREMNITSSQIIPLSEAGFVRVERVDYYRDPYAEKNIDKTIENSLSDEQRAACDGLFELYNTNEAKCALLFGVTGSGKTRVIIELIKRVTGSGKQVIYLVPEISLTPQTIAIFKLFFGERVALMHSSLSDGERADAWLRMKNGDAEICIGTRSAVFAPFERLGLIIIDEEQEHTYKSDLTPRYSTFDIARFRSAYNKSLTVLSSATPSLECYFKARHGVFSLMELKERYGGATLPETRFADMRIDSKEGEGSPIGSELREEIDNRLKKGEQSILFINRRGYNNFISCPHCGKVCSCTHCSVSLTFHTTGRHYEDNVKNGYLTCHYCGYRTFPPEKCPDCGKETFRFMGYGTQKVEEELNKLFPEARIMRLDADTVNTKFAYDEKLSAFRRGEADILLGTQMVAKGHDFPNVTLVGVISADSSLYVEDYRANERTFSLLTQVTGRAGRADKKGLSLIQTYTPENATLLYAKSQDYISFYQNEIKLRKNYLFPPFCDIVLLELSSGDENELLKSCVRLNSRFIEMLKSDYPDIKLQLYGPFEAPRYKLKEKYYMRLIIKCRMDKRCRRIFSDIYTEFEKNSNRKVMLSIDVNPNSLMS